MSQKEKVEEIFSKAEVFGKEYEWLKAADLYGQALRVVGKNDFLKIGEVQERVGYAFYRAAMQAESQEEFKGKMRRAVEAYERACEFYERLENEQKAGRGFRCKAIAKYLSYWLTSDPSEKRKLLDDCLELEGKALSVFSESGNTLEFGRTYNEFPLVFFNRFHLEWDGQTARGILKKGVEWGEKAVAMLSELGELHEIASACFILATCLSTLCYFFIPDPEEQEKTRLRANKDLNRAASLSEKVGDDYLLGLSHFWLGINTGGGESVKHFEKTLECGKRTRDNFLIGSGLDFIAFTTCWEFVATEDPEKRRQLAERSMQLYEEGQHHYSIISFMSPRGGVIGPPAGYAEHYYFVARDEIDSEKRREFLEKSEKLGIEALKLAEDSDMPIVVQRVLHVVSKSLEARARMEPDPTEKRSRLEKALKYREKSIEIMKELEPFSYWDLGVMHNYLAGIKAELAEIESDLENKKRLFEEAVSSKEKCLQLCDKVTPYYEKMGIIETFAALRGYQDAYATLLTRLYDLTNKPEYLRKTLEVLHRAIESAKKPDMTSLIAESQWKIAKTQDILGEHLKAAENFAYASESYMKAAEKIPQLKNLYQDLASYMRAWNEIEQAKHHHVKSQYGQAKEHYEKAANLHKSTERWNYLHLNYLALARLEEAEDLSRREQTEEASDLFQQAANLLKEAKQTIKAKLETIEPNDEKEMATQLAKASDSREEYCIGRIALEEAKILDKKGDHYSSSEKYGSAIETFEKILQTLESEQDRKEFSLIISLSHAWQKMMMAEAKASATIYGEAAELFKQAKEHTTDQSTSLLAVANSSFCKALEAGTEFETTRDTTTYSTAKKHMEAAANYYLKAGYESASEYARATNRLFDAYMYIHKAETETEPQKKAQHYQMAEEILQASSGSYMKAKHPEKSEEVKRLLESVKEERQLAMSLSDLLHAPAIASATASFATPTPTYEKAVGLERFEHADIQANLILKVKEAKVGEDIILEIEMVNAGKAPALLIKVQEIIPETFEIKEAPQTYRVEDRYLNMKGKRLDPLKTEEVKIVVKPLSKGKFTIKPRILYLDENGKYKSHEPEPTPITVKELGIKGWIKGER